MVPPKPRIRKAKVRARQERESQNASSSDDQGPLAGVQGKKRKRLAKYIDTKLKKEENLALIKKLAKHKIDTGLFRSSKKLGRVTESRREALSRAYKEREAGIEVEKNTDVLFDRGGSRQERFIDEEGEGVREHDGEAKAANKLSASVHMEDNKVPMASAKAVSGPVASDPVASVRSPIEFGAGLKRPLTFDEAGIPRIQKRQRMKPPPSKYITQVSAPETPAEDDWQGFSSGEEEDLESSIEGSDSDNDDGSDDNEISTGSSGSPRVSENDESEVDDDDEDSGVEDENHNLEALQGRSSSFKAWANQQRNEALGFTPSRNMDIFPTSRRKAPETGELQPLAWAGFDTPKIVTTTNTRATSSPIEKRVIYNVSVTRSTGIQEARLALPVVAEEQRIMEAIHNHNCTIIWGATGSGKTTQVPQFLFEAGYGSPDGLMPGLIGVTQPRRVAAVGMAKRVAVELGNQPDKVAYQIRFDSTVGPKTAIKFMTDGVLLREIAQDFTLSKYSAIIVDEAHERSLNTDLLIGMLSRIVDTRSDLSAKNNTKFKPLKLVIMSATLRTAEFRDNKVLFRRASPPIVQVEGRQYPVTIHFARRTQREYVEEAFQKISRGHKKLPPGGMLVFMTGQNEITALAKRLRDTFPFTQAVSNRHPAVRVSALDAVIEDEDLELLRYNQDGEEDDVMTEIRGLDNDVDEDDENEFDISEEDPHETLKVHVLPLYSQLPMDHQSRVFEPPPHGSRLIVLATNVAETSLTIPGIRYVFDCGRAKEKTYNPTTGVQSFDVGWISKASADQRAGRAGRTAPGHCYRLYSSAVYERDFIEFAEPEILRAPLEGLVLQLKSMGIPKITTFPFPTPPDRQGLVKAERLLENLGAISDGNVTNTGKELSLYPLSPRLARILLLAKQHDCLDHALALVSLLTVPDIFIAENQLDLNDPPPAAENQSWHRTEVDHQVALRREERRKEHATFHGHASRLDRSSDAIKILTIFCDYTQNIASVPQSFYAFTHVKALREAAQLRSQLAAIVAAHQPGIRVSIGTAPLPVPTAAQVKILRQVVVGGYIDQIAQRADLSPSPPADGPRKPKSLLHVPYVTLFPSLDPGELHDVTDGITDSVPSPYAYIHPSSILAHTTSAVNAPQFIVYSHLSRPSVGPSAKVPKVRLHPLTPTSPEHLARLAQGTPLLQDGKPIGKIENMTRSPEGFERRAVYTVPFLRGGEGGLGWPLPPARRVVQHRVPGKGWVEE